MGDPVRFKVDSGASVVKMQATSNVHPIHGQATGVDGYVELYLNDQGRPDLDQPHSARIELKVENIATGNSLYDNELARRMEVRKFPRIIGELTATGHGGDDRYQVEGNLTFHGATKPVQTDMTVRFNEGQRLEAEWQQTIDIRDFNLTPPRILAFKMDPQVTVQVNLVADKEEN